MKRRTVLAVLGCASIVLAACGTASSQTPQTELPVNYSRIATAPDGARFATVTSFAHTQVVENDGRGWYLGTPTGVSTRKGLVLAVGPDSKAWAAEVEHGTLFFSVIFSGLINHWHHQVMLEGIGQSPGSLWPAGSDSAYVIEGNEHYGKAKQSVIQLSDTGSSSTTVASMASLSKMEARGGCSGAELEAVVNHGTSAPEVLALCGGARKALVMDVKTQAESAMVAPHGDKFLGFSSFVDHYGVPLIAAVVGKDDKDSAVLYLEQGGANGGPMSVGLSRTLSAPPASGPSIASSHGNVVVVVPQKGGRSEVITEIKGSVVTYSGPRYGQGAGVSATGLVSVVAANPVGTSVRVDSLVNGKWVPENLVAIPTGSGTDYD